MPNWSVFCSDADALGESPFWHAQEQMLYWVDIPGRRLRRANGFTGAVQSWALEQEPGCIAPARSGGWVVALRDGIYRAPTWGGAMQRLVAAPFDTAGMRFNDGKCDPQGRLWVGSIDETRVAQRAALYRLERQPTARLVPVVHGATVSNGLAWAADGRTLYWADTPSHSVQAWDWDAASGNLSAQREWVRFAPKPADWSFERPGTYRGRPDGAAVDVQGCYWVALYEGARVCRIAPDGRVLAEIETPVQCPTMPCLGGDDGQTLFITTARHRRSASELAQQPSAGCVFSLRVDVPGLSVNFFDD